MKEYRFENGHEIDIAKLKHPFIPKDQYKDIHGKIIRLCHDVLIEYNKGILLVTRREFPVSGIPWMLGGGVQRGVNIEESLRNKVREECNLELDNIKELGCARTFFETDPFNHKKGTDTFNIVYFARGKGELRLNPDHLNPIIVTLGKYTEDFRNSLHPYVRDYMDIATKLL